MNHLMEVRTQSGFAEQRVGSLDQLEQILMRQVIDEVVIALPVKSRYQQIQHAIGVCERAGVQAKYGADLFESTVAFPTLRLGWQTRRSSRCTWCPTAYRLVDQARDRYRRRGVGLVVLSPLHAARSRSRSSSRAPVRSSTHRTGAASRSGRSGCTSSGRCWPTPTSSRPVSRTRNEASGPVFKIRDDPRITPLGRVLAQVVDRRVAAALERAARRHVAGGPAPAAVAGRATGSRGPSDMRRFSMRPGLTCLWQVQGRSQSQFRALGRARPRIHRHLVAGCWIVGFSCETIPAVLSGNGANVRHVLSA